VVCEICGIAAPSVAGQLRQFVDTDVRQGHVKGSIRFGPNMRRGLIYEERITEYRVHIVDASRRKLGSMVARADLQQPTIDEGCCSDRLYIAHVAVVLPLGAESFMIVPVVDGEELPLGAVTETILDLGKETNPEIVEGTLELSVSDPASFLQDDIAKLVVQGALANAIGVPLEMVSISSLVAAPRRLLGTSVRRRLALGRLLAGYAVTVPSGIEPSEVVSSLEGDAVRETLASNIAAGLAQALDGSVPVVMVIGLDWGSSQSGVEAFYPAAVTRDEEWPPWVTTNVGVVACTGGVLLLSAVLFGLCRWCRSRAGKRPSGTLQKSTEPCSPKKGIRRGSRPPVDLEERFSEALHCLQAKRVRGVAALPASRARLTVPLRPGRSSKEAEACESLREAVAWAAAAHGVELADVTAELLSTFVHCDVQIRGSGASALAVVEALEEALAPASARSGGGEVLSQAVLNVGGEGKAGQATALMLWPFRRIQAEIELDYGYSLPISELRKLEPALWGVQDAMQVAWERARRQSPAEAMALQALSAVEPLACFGGRLLTLEEGERQHLHRDRVEQGVDKSAELLAGAARAQRQLKSLLAPGTAWSQADLSDQKKLPRSSELRYCRLGPGPDTAAPNGVLYDPGLPSDRRVSERARRLMRPLDANPRIRALTDLSQLSISFESAECLHQTMEWVYAHLEMVSMENTFKSPSCTGNRELRIVVRQLVPAEETTGDPPLLHLSELNLSLKELSDVRRREARRLTDSIRGMLTDCGVQERDIDGVQELILKCLDCTDGLAMRDSLEDLRYFAEQAAAQTSSTSATTEAMAKDLVREARKLASEAGAPKSEVKRIQEEAKLGTSPATTSVLSATLLPDALSLCDGQVTARSEGLCTLGPESLVGGESEREESCQEELEEAAVLMRLAEAMQRAADIQVEMASKAEEAILATPKLSPCSPAVPASPLLATLSSSPVNSAYLKSQAGKEALQSSLSLGEIAGNGTLLVANLSSVNEASEETSAATAHLG